MIGAVAKCCHGKIGVVAYLELEMTSDGDKVPLYKGVTLDGKSWQSPNPCILAANVNEYILGHVLPKFVNRTIEDMRHLYILAEAEEE